jgi:hypothetical protein
LKHDHRKCEDEEDAARMAATILRRLGYHQLALGSNSRFVHEELSPEERRQIALDAERIGRWARDKS